MKTVFSFIMLIVLFLFSTPAHADWIDPRADRYQTPYRSIDPTFFPSCPHVRGAIKAYYSTGTHAIPGRDGTLTGADIVYDQGNFNATQCFCPTTGKEGIQTNWLSTHTLSENERDWLLHNGWIKITSGTSWGLHSGEYLAKNTSFMCLRPL